MIFTNIVEVSNKGNISFNDGEVDEFRSSVILPNDGDGFLQYMQRHDAFDIKIENSDSPGEVLVSIGNTRISAPNHAMGYEQAITFYMDKSGLEELKVAVKNALNSISLEITEE